MSRPCGCEGDRGRHRQGCALWRPPAPYGSVKATAESARQHHRERDRLELEEVVAQIPPPEEQLLQPIRDEDVDMPSPSDVPPEQYGFNIARREKRQRPPKKVYEPRKSVIQAYKCEGCGNRQLRAGICCACGRDTLRQLNV